jgi:hypothetical protein
LAVMAPQLLESRSLIKSVQGVHSKTKKLYMLFDTGESIHQRPTHCNIVQCWPFTAAHIRAYRGVYHSESATQRELALVDLV